ncbi:MAG: hypothetical protein A2W61_06030 [Deltaproteobacteria bacterium RIFCSPLOWO2_01_44_7]|nr:MAG: hypothetical protein A2712_06280 [Deltaproteobacteria bacterium RIFCSPHIGHO2_01_FULL_43_49]OGQ16734.1 MAG: hypothetical protein A3D22_07405 [Deltaproteobacteria bacterium RIFCSPHIGHO2_02_FULL_44_53]OGQ29872.1 MAG: hypothetical protein A3D98_10070 [Deltaproteobacteria bacterium RIFCSPHIGHO2_12_FULL_44_21]OGQ33162.1 MAG: hypothetical protein A2979_04050 [Deltaproteobacteria bacterium RIFCSPLOWO2_01_FULL_45_74]OGQ42257.1 MAG: hypothetical protein A3I70_06355 [Deltaproteobacteria bacterium 
MANDLTIKETCEAIQAVGFPIALQNAIIAPNNPEHGAICERFLQEAVTKQRELVSNHQPSIWSHHQIQTIADYAKKHGLSVLVLGPFAQSLSALVGQIRIGLMTYVEFKNEFSLSFALDHEVGHMRDFQFIARQYPEIEGMEEPVDHSAYVRTHRDKVMRYIEAFKKLFKKKIPKKDQNRFDALAQEIFGNPQAMDNQQVNKVANFIAELFRMGEEIRDPRKENEIFGSDIYIKVFGKEGIDQKKDRIANGGLQTPTGQKIDANMILFMATIQEAGLWEKFRKRPGFDPNSIRHINLKHVEFARICIRAAAQYFPN